VLHRPVELAQYVSIVYNEGLAERGITASTGTIGDSYDNALADNVNGSYKNELIHTRTWNDVVEVEIATFEWVLWWNEARRHQGLWLKQSRSEAKAPRTTPQAGSLSLQSVKHQHLRSRFSWERPTPPTTYVGKKALKALDLLSFYSSFSGGVKN
jgi:hypothetical protein